MKHNMNLNNRPFKSIKEGTKTIELRLNDEKRSLLKVGDEIEFTNRDTNEKSSTSYIFKPKIVISSPDSYTP